MPDHAVLYNRSPISDRRVNNNYKLGHVGIRRMIEVRLHYDQIVGAIEILQVPLHFKHFYLYSHISPISEGIKERPIRTINNTYLVYQPVTISTKEN